MDNKNKYEKYRPKKFLGQNFLTDVNISKKIISFLEIEDGDTVLEIGPGHGALTEHLVSLDINLTAIEFDKFVYEELKNKYGVKLNILSEDFLKTDLTKLFTGKKLKIIGNIPYYITSQILFKLFENHKIISRSALMMQKEVAMRLKSEPNSKEYGILSIFTNLYTIPKIAYSVPRTVFFPKPKVDSSVVSFDFKINVEEPVQPELFREVVRTSFNQRRKTLRNSLRKFFDDKNIDINLIKFDLSKRPEMLSINDFKILTDEIISVKR
ncbi:MAG TPA: ribosomal RNA small subunit methyltransferase A [Bacteroidetes bacterium]|nr:ribosomal RNA small subunit methyltransferase A [Bacteroidota bacterium]